MRIIASWSGGASISQSHYRLIYDSATGEYITQILAGAEYRTLGRFEHLKAQQLAVHMILDDKDRIERREIREAFIRKLKRA